jgi:hypothetical protein
MIFRGVTRRHRQNVSGQTRIRQGAGGGQPGPVVAAQLVADTDHDDARPIRMRFCCL